MPSPSHSPTGLPFDDIRDLLTRMPGPDEAAIAAVRARDAELTKPAGALGRLETIVEWVAAWSANPKPRVDRPLVAIFATAHGVTKQGVSAFPDAVNRQMLDNFAAGGAAVNQLCVANDIGLKVFDLAIDVPTPDITEEDAFDEAACAATIAFGMEAIVGADLLCLGEMGIGNTTIAAASITPFMAARRRTGSAVAPASMTQAWRARPRSWPAPSPAPAARALIRWRCFAGSVAARSPPPSAPSSPRACSASRFCSTAMS